MTSIAYRLREFLSPDDGRSLIVDTSAGLWQGPLPGLENFSDAAQQVLPLVDGLVTSPGMARTLAGRTRSDAALLVRADWTNALRSPDFVLPPETISRIPLVDPAAALDLGASALVLTFLLGHDEQVEADCLKQTVQHSLAASQVGLPLLVDVQPVGPRVRHLNKAIELGVSYALEGGADGVAVPWPGEASFATIRQMAHEVPVWVKPASVAEAPARWPDAQAAGAVGLWLEADVFAGDASDTLSRLAGQVHAREVAR